MTRKAKIKKVHKRKLSKLIIPFGIIFLIGTVFLTIQTATTGAKVAYFEKKEQELIQENRELKDKLVRSSSLTQISESADSLGFVKPDNIIYLSPEDPVAILP